MPHPDRPADRRQRRHGPLKSADQDVVEVQRSGDPLGNLIDRLKLPHQPPVVQVHAPAVGGALNRGQERLAIDRLLHEAEGGEFAGADERWKRTRGRHDDDLRLGVVCLDPPHHIQGGVVVGYVDEGDVAAVNRECGVHVSRCRGPAHGVPTIDGCLDGLCQDGVAIDDEHADRLTAHRLSGVGKASGGPDPFTGVRVPPSCGRNDLRPRWPRGTRASACARCRDGTRTRFNNETDHGN
jgi:hypothetical protein